MSKLKLFGVLFILVTMATAGQIWRSNNATKTRLKTAQILNSAAQESIHCLRKLSGWRDNSDKKSSTAKITNCRLKETQITVTAVDRSVCENLAAADKVPLSSPYLTLRAVYKNDSPLTESDCTADNVLRFYFETTEQGIALHKDLLRTARLRDQGELPTPPETPTKADSSDRNSAQASATNMAQNNAFPDEIIKELAQKKKPEKLSEKKLPTQLDVGTITSLAQHLDNPDLYDFAVALSDGQTIIITQDNKPNFVPYDTVILEEKDGQLAIRSKLGK